MTLIGFALAKLFDKLKLTGALERLEDQQFYDMVASELARGERSDGLWLKALSESNGDDHKAKAKYIKFRVQSLKDEIELSTFQKHQEEEQERARQQAKKNEAKQFDEVTIAINKLAKLKYRVARKGDDFLIKEPLGGRVKLGSKEELITYLKAVELRN